jgi:hypothetical protein
MICISTQIVLQIELVTTYKLQRILKFDGFVNIKTLELLLQDV